MKKTVIFLLLCMALILSSCSFAKQEKTYNQALTLLEQQKTEEAFELLTSIKDYKDSAQLLSNFVYLPERVVTSDYGFGSDTEPVLQVTLYPYDEKGNLLTYSGTYQDDRGPEFSETHEYTDGKLTRTRALSEAGDSTITYEYDSDGRIAKTIGATEGANVGGISLFTYDANGNCIRKDFTSYHGADTTKYTEENAYHRDTTTYEYDADGNCTKVSVDYGDNRWSHTAKYDKNGITAIVTLDGDGKQTETTFSYNTEGNCTKVVTDYETATFEYDENGLLVASTHKQGESLLRACTYSFSLYYLPDGNPNPPVHLSQYLTDLDPYA